tara:strand:+ start:123 stop:368 length:246 start_codon:yes stop_codon:yes gene_type:complete
VAGLSVLKVFVCTGFAFAVGMAFGLDRHTGVLIVQMALPVAVRSYLLAAKYGAEAQPVAGLAVVSTLMAVVALPLILAVFV